MPVEVGHVRPDLQPVATGRAAIAGVDPRAGDDDHPQAGHQLLGLRERRDHPPQQRRRRPPEPPTVTMQTRSSGAVAEPPRSVAVGQLGRVEAGDVAGEVEVLLGPVPDRTAARARSASGTTSSGSPTKIARSRTRGYRAMCSIISAL